MFNDFLPPLVDHINRNKLDNRIENLRPLTPSENARNCGDKHYKYKLPRGVTIQKGKFKAQVKINKKTVSIGLFPTAEEAASAYKTFIATLKHDRQLTGHPVTP